MTRQEYYQNRGQLRQLMRYEYLIEARPFRKRRVAGRGLEYIWNTESGNVVATVNRHPEMTVVRYRPASRWRHVLADITMPSGKTVKIPSRNLGKHRETILSSLPSWWEEGTRYENDLSFHNSAEFRRLFLEPVMGPSDAVPPFPEIRYVPAENLAAYNLNDSTYSMLLNEYERGLEDTDQ